MRTIKQVQSSAHAGDQKGAQNGALPCMVLNEAEAAKITGPATVDGICEGADWQAYWRAFDAERRARAGWPAPLV